ncbi:MAG: hypothetical protein RLZZ584_2199 [Pseudomonadota bacterium]|jgi:GT2 family glycosyltransferase
MCTVSVIIVSWNARRHLEACLRSIEAAAPACVTEIIVVDNASADGSADCVAQQFPQVRLVRAGANLGFARANNLAMRQAGAESFALVNSDALVHRGSLETLAAHLDRHPGVGLVGPRVSGADGLLQRTCRRLPGPWNTLCRALALDRLLPGQALFSGYELPPARHETAHEAEVLSGCFCLARRAAVEQVGGFDEQFFFYGEDIDWCKRLRDAGWKIAYLPAATAVHLGGGSTAGAPLRFSVEILRATLTYWRKHHGRAGLWLCRGLLILHHLLRLLPRLVLRGLGLLRSAEARRKLVEDLTCLRWLCFGTEVAP